MSTAAAGGRPRPVASPETEFFWEAIARGELRIQRCAACGRLRHPPGPMCPACGSLDWDSVVSSGRGTVFSAIVPRHPELAMFGPAYVVVLVELQEGVRFVSNLRGVDPDEVSIGMAVEVFFPEVEPGLVLPQFRPAVVG